ACATAASPIAATPARTNPRFRMMPSMMTDGKSSVTLNHGVHRRNGRLDRSGRDGVPLPRFRERARGMKTLNSLALSMAVTGLMAASAPVSGAQVAGSQAQSFQIMETSIDDIHAAFKAGRLTAHQLVQAYLDRIAAYDKKGPNINSIITLNTHALEEADRLDA